MMSEYFPETKSSGGNVKVELEKVDLVNLNLV